MITSENQQIAMNGRFAFDDICICICVFVYFVSVFIMMMVILSCRLHHPLAASTWMDDPLHQYLQPQAVLPPNTMQWNLEHK